MAISIGVVMDPINAISYHKDTSLALLLAAQKRGWDLWYMETANLYARQGQAMAGMCPLQVAADPANWYTLSESQNRPLASLNVILMRKDPPVDQSFLYAAMLLDLAEAAGCKVINRPRALMRWNEKLFALRFPDLAPETLVSSNHSLLNAFIDEQQDTILKPLDGMGGASIFRVRSNDPNRNVILETLTAGNSQLVMAQRFLPEISAGDKRVLVINGEPFRYGLARIPQAGETRGNLAAGGRGEGFEIGAVERAICAEVGPVLREEGVLFAGLDIIGERLTEINITSPTCIREINRAFDVRVEDVLLDAIESDLQLR